MTLKKIKKKLIKVLNTSEIIMEIGAFAPKEAIIFSQKCSIKYVVFKGVKRRYYGVKGNGGLT